MGTESYQVIIQIIYFFNTGILCMKCLQISFFKLVFYKNLRTEYSLSSFHA